MDLRYGSHKIAPLWTKVEKGAYTGDPKNPPDPGYDLSEEENLKEFAENFNLVSQIKEQLTKSPEPLDEKRVTWLCTGKYVYDMLRAKVTEENWQKPFKYLRIHLFCVLSLLQRGLKQVTNLSFLSCP